MKKKNDPRHLKRVRIIKELFTWNFQPKKQISSINQIILNIDKIDELIQQAAPGRPINKINRIDLAILRLAFFEIIIKKDVPPKVVIDEAVELAKEYGSDSSSAFVNGSLGKLVELTGIKT